MHSYGPCRACLALLLLILSSGCGAREEASAAAHHEREITPAAAYEMMRSSVAGGAGGSGVILPDYGTLVEDGIVITDPPSGTIVSGGDTVPVTITGQSGFVPMQVLLGSSLDSAFDTEAPFVLDIEVPEDALGTVAVSAMAVNAGWDFAFSASIELVVTTTETLMKLTVTPDFIVLFTQLNPTDQLEVIGTFTDGVDRVVTASVLGTTYDSQSTEVVTVDAEGMLTAVDPGITTVLVTNGTVTTTGTVVVESLPCLGDANLDQDVGFADQLVVLTEWGVCEGCAGDLDQDGDVDFADLLIVITNGGPCGY